VDVAIDGDIGDRVSTADEKVAAGEMVVEDSEHLLARVRSPSGVGQHVSRDAG